MCSKKMNPGSRDLISGLPDCLICHILSFVSTKEAASTSVLARRWRYLFAPRPNLDFDDSVYLNPEKKRNIFPWITKKTNKVPESFMDFVDRVLVLQGNAPINRFSLKCEDVVHSAIVISWILKVLRRGLSDLDLQISTELGCPLPSEIFVSNTLVRLKIGISDVLTIKVKDVFLPKVKFLCLENVIIKNSVFAKLLSGCEALEELVLNNLMWEFTRSCSIFNRTIKSIMFHRSRTFDRGHKSVSFDTPNLVYLEYSDTIADKYPKVNFNSLVEASLGLRMTSAQILKAKFPNENILELEEEMDGNATDFFMGICNVKILYLSDDTLQVLTYCCKPMPEFINLIQLTIKTFPDVTWESLPALLKNCPNLETLIFEGLHHKPMDTCGDKDGCLCKYCDEDEEREDVPRCLSSSPVKVIKILKFGEVFDEGDDIEEQINQVKHFLETMPNLEQLVLYYDTSFDEDVNEVSTQLQMLTRVASPKCKVELISDNLSLSSFVPCSVARTWGPLL